MMYPDLYRGIGLRRKISLSTIRHWGFNGWMVIPKRQISLLVNMEGKEVMVTFIVVTSNIRKRLRRLSYSNYRNPKWERGLVVLRTW